MHEVPYGIRIVGDRTIARISSGSATRLFAQRRTTTIPILHVTRPFVKDGAVVAYVHLHRDRDR